MAHDPRSVADAYLGLLADRGVEYLFGNAGTDFGPIIDAYARRSEAGELSPAPVPVTHEVTAMAMAHGYGMVSGSTPAVMVHTVAGTANAVGGLINANRARQALYLTAGRTPLTEGDRLGARDMHIHWSQESFDQGAMVREWVKWDYELRAGADLVAVVDRAFAMAESDPPGPVYLTLPREVLAAEHDGGAVTPARTAIGRTVPEPGLVAQAARILREAERPVLITRSAGRDRAAPPLVARLAEMVGAPVYDPYPTHSNLDFDHPLRIVEAADRAVADADVVVVVESDVPWTPRRGRPGVSTTVIGIGSDPLHGGYPVRSFEVDVNLTGAIAPTLAVLVAELEQGGPIEAAPARRAEWSENATRSREGARERARALADARPLAKPFVSQVLDGLLPDDAILVDELGVDVAQMSLQGPGRFYGVSQAGVLGWSLGASLGAKLAAPDRTVVCVVGDGSYLFGVPTTAHWASRRYGLPVLYVVWNNATWGAVERATRMVYPEGHAARSGEFAFAGIGPSIDHELVCQAAGGYGERVEDPGEVGPAIGRGLAEVAAGRQALLNVIAH